MCVPGARLLVPMPPSALIGPRGPHRRRGAGGTAAERRRRRRTDGRGPKGQTGGRGDSGTDQRCGRGVLAPSCGWHAVVLAGEVWAVCQEEAPLHPSLYLCQVWSRALLAGVLWLGLALCLLFLRAVVRRWSPQQGAPCLQAQEVMRERAAVPLDSSPSGRSPNGPVPLAEALMDSLLLFLLSEALDDPCPAHIRAHAHRLEMVMQTLDRADVLGDGSKRGPRGSEEHPLLTDTLLGVRTFLQQRVLWLRALAQAQGDYGYSMQGAKEGLEQRWALLGQLHSQVTLRKRRRSEAEEQVLLAVKKEREGEEDIKVALRSVECFFVDLAQCKGRLQQSHAHLSDITHLLQDLGASLRALGEGGDMEVKRGGVEAEPLWTERLLQASTQQFDEAIQDFLSLEKLTSCFQTHLEGLRADQLSQEGVTSHLSPAPKPHIPQTRGSCRMGVCQLSLSD
ncbi:hypothetical protein ANANG_G00241050 [Anguilla anguilla]|uniref:Uncharacterized protein n=1 Tax=Anguilla anguilla TaxID=7936 RepID=A0A9D3LV43_ANGAN|nr:hypothetical protein ANANG_G00241050 [Anguilla anguilla]